MKHILPSFLFLMVLTACNTATPVVENIDVPSSVNTDAWSMLHSTEFPEGWKAIPGDCGPQIACFYSPEAYTGANTAVDHDTFFVQLTRPEQCNEAFAQTQAAMHDEDAPVVFALFGIDLGYTWMGYAGAGVQPGDPYTMRFVCIHHPTAGFDILISSYIADTKTTNYLDSMFIPFWLNIFIVE